MANDQGVTGSIKLVNPVCLTTRGDVSKRDVRYQKARLEKEGQIMPTVVKSFRKDAPRYMEVDDEDWPYASALILAAIELEWDTVMVTDDRGED